MMLIQSKILPKNSLFKQLFRQYNELLELLKVLYRLGYVVISQEVNMVFGPRDPDGLYNLLEVVFMRVWIDFQNEVDVDNC